VLRPAGPAAGRPHVERTLHHWPASWDADLPTDAYVLVDGHATGSQLMGGVGLVARVSEAFSSGLDYSYTANSASDRSENITATLSAPF
jgi:hypothetical protein